MCNNCGSGSCVSNSCTNCGSSCSSCVDCVESKVVVVRPLRNKDNCESIVETVRSLLAPEIGDCSGLSLSGTSKGGVVILISSDSNVTYSNNGKDWVSQNAFMDEPSGNNTYFVKNDAGCVASTTVVVNSDCVPNFVPKIPSVTTCIGGKVNVMYIDGCGSEEWRPTATDCVDQNTYCSLVLNIVPESVECLTNGTTKVTVSVTGNNGNSVEFFDPTTLSWISGNISNSSHLITIPSNGQNYNYKARLAGCDVVYNGYFTTCQPSTNSYTYTRSEVVSCEPGCAQSTILFSKTYTGQTQQQAQEIALNDSTFALEAAAYASQNCNCGSFNVTVDSVSCSVLPPVPVPESPTTNNTLFYQIKRCSDNALFYTTTLGVANNAAKDSSNVDYIYTGNASSLPSTNPPSGNIGAVTKTGQNGCPSTGGCSISPVSVGNSTSVVVQNETSNSLSICWQPSGSTGIISSVIPANSGVFTFCVNEENYQDVSGLLSISIGGSCN